MRASLWSGEPLSIQLRKQQLIALQSRNAPRSQTGWGEERPQSVGLGPLHNPSSSRVFFSPLPITLLASWLHIMYSPLWWGKAWRNHQQDPSHTSDPYSTGKKETTGFPLTHPLLSSYSMWNSYSSKCHKVNKLLTSSNHKIVKAIKHRLIKLITRSVHHGESGNKNWNEHKSSTGANNPRKLKCKVVLPVVYFLSCENDTYLNNCWCQYFFIYVF